MFLITFLVSDTLQTFVFPFQDDVFSHLYTLVVKPDNTYIVKIDNKKVESGDLEADWDFLAPKKIKVKMDVSACKSCSWLS